MKPDGSDDRKPTETERDPDLAGATAAMHRAARRPSPRGGEWNPHPRIRGWKGRPGESG